MKPTIRHAIIALAFCLFWSGATQCRAQTVVEKAKRATALVSVLDGYSFGSAFCIDASGLFVTNEHVVRGVRNEKQMVLVLNSGTDGEKKYPARVLRVDEETDLALLKIESDAPLPTLELGSSDKLFETMPVAALGFPFGDELALEPGASPNVTVNVGRITALRRAKGRLREIQTDAAVNPGNSGGPLIDDEGRVIGVVYASIEGAAGLHFAIPVSLVRELLEKPALLFTPPIIRFEERTKIQEFRIQLTSFRPTTAPYAVEMKIGFGDDARTVQAAPEGKDVFVVRAAPILVPREPEIKTIPYKITVRQNNRVVAEQTGAMTMTAPPKVASPKPNAPTGDDWLGVPNVAGAPNAPMAGVEVEVSGRDVLQPPRTVKDATVYKVSVEAKNIVPEMLWSKDGRFLYLLESTGALRKISVPEWKEEKVLQTRQVGRYLAQSAQGLLVGLPAVGKIWVVDPDSLAVKKQIPMPTFSALTAAPSSDYAYAILQSGSGYDLAVIDVAKGEVVKTYNAREVQREQGEQIKKNPRSVVLVNFGHVKMTPDGTYLFVESFECLHRFRVEGANLLYEEIGARIGSNVRTIEVSPDSRYVAMPSGGGNGSGYGTFIYRIGDLSQPAVTVAGGAYPQTLAFDKAAGLLYTQNHSKQLLVFTPGGLLQADYTFASASGMDNGTQHIVAHPDGYRLLVLTGKDLFWVELPGAPPAPPPTFAPPTVPDVPANKNRGRGFGGFGSTR